MRQYPFIYNQRDAAWAGNQLGTVAGATIGQYGCLLTCHAMKAGYYGHEIKPNALNDIYTQKNLYISGDLLSDADINAVFSDITLTETRDYANVPADLNYLKQLATDATITVTIELDFDHDPNDGIQTHFVELQDYDGTTLHIYDPWYGTLDDFALHYGNNPAQTIQKIAVYKGTPVAPAVSVDAVTFERLVTNSSAYDAVCDTLSEPHNTSKDKIVGDINQLKADKANAEQTVSTLNQQLPQLKTDNETLTGQIKTLQQQLQDAQAAQVHPDSGIDYKTLYTQAESDLAKSRQEYALYMQTTNRQISQLQNTSATTMDLKKLWGIVIQRSLRLS